MGKAYTVIHTFKQNITGGAFEALAAGSSDSLTVANFAQSSRAWLEDLVGGNSAHAGDFDVRSPKFHDNTRGIRVAAMFNPTLTGADGDPQILLPKYAVQPLYPSDVLVAEVNATAADNVALDIYVYYEDLPGIAMRLAMWEEVMPRVKNFLGIKVGVTAGATGDYGTARALNADDDRLKADTDYAILGATSQLPCGLLTIKGPDTSNTRLPMPLHWDEEKSAGWLVDSGIKYGRPHIPIINSNNKGNTLLEAADAATNVATIATLIMAELG